MKCGLGVAGLLLGASLSSPALAQDGDEQSEESDSEEAEESKVVTLGLDPGTPQVGTLPGGLTPSFGQPVKEDGELHFDFHGFLTMPLRAGLNRRDGEISPGQSKLVLHAPPVVPDYLSSFTYTGVVPQPYGQLNFTYGNSIVTGNVILLARTAASAQTFVDPASVAGISDAFLAFKLHHLLKNLRLDVRVGIFNNRYGVMGEYDMGRYGTPLVAQINGAGATTTAQLDVGNYSFALEQGIQGQLDKPPLGLLPSGWNGYADPNTGSGFAHHLHAGASYRGIASLGLHHVFAFTQDDRASQGTTPDGQIHVFAADVRLSMEHFGHFYAGVSHTSARDSAPIGGIIQVLNTTGGRGLMMDYFGPNSGGTGRLWTVAAQYDLSIGRLLRYPNGFDGNAPDIVVSLFGMQTYVKSNEAVYDRMTKRKYGAEAGYGFLPWLAAGLRFDRVEPDKDAGCTAGASCAWNDVGQSFTVISPRLIFRSKWRARDQVVLQYSHWFHGSGTVVRNGTPPAVDPTIHPDSDVISLSASMWW